MKANRKFTENKSGAINMIVMGLLILIISALAIAVFYPIISAVDTTTIDAGFGGVNETPSANATSNVISTGNTVMGLNPLAGLVAVAAGIIALLLGAFLSGAGTKL